MAILSAKVYESLICHGYQIRQIKISCASGLKHIFVEKLGKDFFESIHLYASLHSSQNLNDNKGK
jgi:hypothetical protein